MQLATHTHSRGRRALPAGARSAIANPPPDDGVSAGGVISVLAADVQATPRIPAAAIVAHAAAFEATTETTRAIAELAHDLRQPLTSLQMNLQWIRRLLQGQEPRIHEAVEVLAECLGAGGEMSDLLARSVDGYVWGSAHIITSSLNAFTQRLRLDLMQFAPPSAPAIEERLATPIPWVRASIGCLRIPLVRMISFALRWTGDEDRGGARRALHTHIAGDRAELRFDGLAADVVVRPGFQSLFAVAASAAGFLGGAIRVGLGDTTASIVLSLPLAGPEPLTPRDGPHEP